MKNTFKIFILFLIVIACNKDDDNTSKSEAKQLISFSFLAENNENLNEDVVAIIDEENKTITATLPYGTNINDLLPTTEVSTKAKFIINESQDLSKPIIYRITAEDQTYVDYSFTVNFTKNDAKELISFTFLAENNEGLNEDIIATIDEENKTISVTLLQGTNINALIPTTKVSAEATVSPQDAQDFSEPVTYRVTAQDETYVEYILTINFSGTNAKELISFTFLAENNENLNEDIITTIDEENKTITATLSNGTNLTALIPTTEVSVGATLSPDGAQDFSEPVTYRVTAQDETFADYVLTIYLESDAKKLISFSFLAENNEAINEDAIATIDEENKTITITIPDGTNITALAPTTEISTEATLSPEGIQDFSEPITYRVTAEDETFADYTLTINYSESDAKKLISFAFLAENNSLNEDVIATIDEENKTIIVAVPYGTDITNLLATTEVSAKATLSPEEVQDFSEAITYKVIAENETFVEYTFTIEILPPSQKQILMIIYNSNPNNTLEWDFNTDINLWNGVTLDNNGNVTHLSLEEKQLTNIPQEIGQLTALTYLSLGKNQLTSIPSEIGKLTNLTRLYLTWNQLTSIPSEIGQLVNLTALNLTWNQLTSIPNEIGQLTNLKHLSLAQNRLSILTNEIKSLANLNTLRLNNNQLTAIPQEIGQLVNLTTLYIESNQLTSIPNQIGQLSNLRDLTLHNNQLRRIPDQIGQLINLDVLLLDNNPLSSIPNQIGQLTNLTMLGLHRTQLRSIPNQIGQLVNLTSLNLSNNQLTSIPNQIAQLTNLRHLSLYRNQLTSIPTEIFQLNSITTLKLDNNLLTSIPQEIGSLTNLTELNLSNNQLTSLPVEIGQLSNLTLLNLSENQLTSLPVEIELLTNLTRLYIVDNLLTSIPNEIAQLNLSLLWADRNQLTSIPQEVCDLNIPDIKFDEGVICE